MSTSSRSFRRFVSENPRFLLVFVGYSLSLGGISAWSVPLACVCAGVLLMAAGLYPYVRGG